MTQSDDPWAKWRKPAAATVRPELISLAAPEATPPVLSEPAVTPDVGGEIETAPAAKPVGTLSVLKLADGGPSLGRKRPVRGGALVRKPRDDKPQSNFAVDARKGEKSTDRAPRHSNSDKPWQTDKARTTSRTVAKPVIVQPIGPAPSGVRLSKVMSERGLCSRREADLWIERGWVFVDGVQISELGSRIDPEARIEVSTEAKKDQAKAVTILLHKPVGYVSGQPEPECIPAVTLITADNQLPQSGDPDFKPWMLRGLAPAGRLDIDSTGLLVMTSDGRVAKRLIGEDSEAEKEYLVRVSGEMIKGGLELLRHGLELDGKPLKPAWIKQLNEDQLHFILKEGKKRQIRRMCELVGLRVIGLKRVRILRADEAF
jgi:23S rRNA pseudouridine2604 synthase